ncbi:MAG: hypothetical protein ACI95C_001448 [Pseudohongiellaceae bacterium]|jgi:hypothetical protein
MNTDKLALAERYFMERYPGGFSHPDMLAIAKKHNIQKATDFAHLCFAKKKFPDTQELLDNWVKLVSRSSMVSIFEKPKFKAFVAGLEPKEKNQLVAGLKAMLYGDEAKGFDTVVKLMQMAKLAKWSLISACPFYFSPLDQVFVKPTTTKGVIAFFELKNLVYRPQPAWGFYAEYRSQINRMKEYVDPSLSPNNAAFSGFLMMSLPKAQG